MASDHVLGDVLRLPAAADGLSVSDYIQLYDARVRHLSRKTMPKLREIERNALEADGRTRAYGQAGTRDELIRSILELEFPDIRKAHELRAARYAAAEEARDGHGDDDA